MCSFSLKKSSAASKETHAHAGVGFLHSQVYIVGKSSSGV